MMIQLTEHDGSQIWINTDHIVYYQSGLVFDNCTYTCMMRGTINVKESPARITHMIDEAMSQVTQ